MVFDALLRWIENKVPSHSHANRRALQLDKQLAIFLHLCRTGAGYANTCNVFGRSPSAVHKAVYRILPALIILHYGLVVPPGPDITRKEIRTNSRFRDFFHNCMGVLDGSLILTLFQFMNRAHGGVERARPAKTCLQPAPLTSSSLVSMMGGKDQLMIVWF